MANDQQNFDCQELDRHNSQKHADSQRSGSSSSQQNSSASGINNRDIQR